jgi:hypothetical protein
VLPRLGGRVEPMAREQRLLAGQEAVGGGGRTDVADRVDRRPAAGDLGRELRVRHASRRGELRGDQPGELRAVSRPPDSGRTDRNGAGQPRPETGRRPVLLRAQQDPGPGQPDDQVIAVHPHLVLGAGHLADEAVEQRLRGQRIRSHADTAR